MTRRRFLAAAGTACAGAAGMGFYAWRIEPHSLSIVERALPIANLPSDLVGRTLVQISDLHVGSIVDTDFLLAAMDRISAMRPDLVAITGDFLNHYTDNVDEAARVVERLRGVTLGTVAVLGNHDYGRGWRHESHADKVTARIEGAGIHVLRNQQRSIAGLNFIGMDDFWSPCFRPREALAGLDPGAANLVLCHNPDAVDLPVWDGYRGWILAGHTHGGQCKPPFLPPPLLPVRNRRYTAGAFELSGDRRLYVNRGLGYLRRVRFNVRPEITCFRLMAAGDPPDRPDTPVRG